jgi:hypothetical protein
MVVLTCNPSYYGRQRQDDRELKAGLGKSSVGPCPQNKIKTKELGS